MAHFRLDSARDRHRDFVLDLQDLLDIAVVSFSPDVSAGLRFDQPRADAQALTAPSDAAFDDVVSAEIETGPPSIEWLPLERERGASRNHEQRSMLGERGDDVFGNALREVLLAGV